MRVLTAVEIAKALAKALHKPILFIAPCWNTEEAFDRAFDKQKRFRSAPYLKLPEDLQILWDGQAFIVCDSEKEMKKLYEQTVGDDGPTKKNRYKGTHTTYALTISAKGELLTENT